MNTFRQIGLAIVCMLACGGAHAQVSERVLYSFTGGSDGSGPTTPLLADSSGPSGQVRALYGLAYEGGVDGGGTAFALRAPRNEHGSWKFSTLWGFTGGGDGENPFAGALFSEARHAGKNTPLYGTTSYGAQGFGTIFSLQGNSLSTIYTFTGGDDGGYPYYGVVADKADALYTAAYGAGAGSCGTVVQLVPPAQGQSAWTENTIYSFTGAADGCGPNSVTIDAHGVLYGTTESGGTVNAYCGAGCGTVFALIPPPPGQTAWSEQTLWSFQGGLDGALSYVPVTLGKHGEIFGTTSSGGNDQCSLYSGCGTVFELVPPAKGGTAWSEQVIASFPPTGNNVPYAAVILDAAGAVYGTTSGNFSEANGSVFRIVPPQAGQTAWTLETLFNFPGGRAGSVPYAAVTADQTGVLYGTTYSAGINNNGIVFSLSGTGFAVK